jgi:glycosyltransferase involved in cell wall biosynthesis
LSTTRASGGKRSPGLAAADGPPDATADVDVDGADDVDAAADAEVVAGAAVDVADDVDAAGLGGRIARESAQPELPSTSARKNQVAFERRAGCVIAAHTLPPNRARAPQVGLLGPSIPPPARRPRAKATPRTMTSIAIDARYVRERPSGVGAVVEALIAGVPSRLPSIDFLLLRHPKAGRRLSTAPNVREVVVAADPNGPRSLAALPRLVDLRGVDLFHAPSNILPFGLRMATVATVHDVMWLETPELCTDRPLYGLLERAFYGVGIAHALRRATRIVTVSDATARDVARLSPAAAARTHVGRLGVPSGFAPTASDAERAEDHARVRALLPAIPEGARYVLAVGQSTPYKNHPRALAAFAEAFADDPRTHLVFVHRLGHVEALARKLPQAIAARVHMLPPVEPRGLHALYRCALVLAHPSLKEGWGLPIGEALACGCPVLTSACASMPEVAGDAAVYVDPLQISSIAQGLRAFVDEPRLRARCIERGFDRVRALRWEAHVDATVEAYRAALGLTR